MRKIFTLICLSFITLASAQESVTFSDLRYWTPAQLAPYVGKTIRLTQPWFVNQLSGSGFYGGPRRLMAPTNQARPLTDDYKRIVSANNAGLVNVTGLGATPRMGEMLTDLVIKVNSTNSVSIVGTPKRHYTYAEMNTPPNVGNCNVKVCCMNLCYFLVENLGSGSQGPTSSSQQRIQYLKILEALSAVNADIYAVCEIEQGQGALEKLANGLTQELGRKFTYIDDGMSASGTWTKSGYIYCSDRIERTGSMDNNNIGVANRKKLQAFRHKESGEVFVLGVNHFKAKVNGPTSGVDSDQGDGQGAFNNARTIEAQSVINSLKKFASVDPDVLLMGDLNAYAKEDPVIKLIEAGFKDLHQVFHADSSYSYVYSYNNYTAGYLDHALANATMAKQVTGMAAWHINSDESYRNSYKYSSQTDKFRSSDHDPIIVGLRLGDYNANEDSGTGNMGADALALVNENGQYVLKGMKQGRLRIYGITGQLEYDEPVDSESFVIPIDDLTPGVHIINAYGSGRVMQNKILVRNK